MTWAAKTLGTESSQKTWRNGGFSCARVKWMMWRWIYWYYISRDPRKKGMVKSEHVNDCKCGSELTPKGTLEEVWLSLTGQYIYMHIYICLISKFNFQETICCLLPCQKRHKPTISKYVFLSSRPQSELWKLYPHQSLALLGKCSAYIISEDSHHFWISCGSFQQ